MYLAKGDLVNSSMFLEKAEKLQQTQDILTNKGIIAARKGELKAAQKLFNEANTTEKNQAILNIRKGEYEKASRFFKNQNSYNATLAKLLNGANSARCNESTAACHYLNAIAAARAANNEAAISYLSKAITLNLSYKKEAVEDLEFFNLRTNNSFIELTK